MRPMQITITALTLLWVAGPLYAQNPPEISATQTIAPETADGPTADAFGLTLALSDDTLMVSMGSGRVAVFTRTRGALARKQPWTRSGSLDPPDPAQTRGFGSFVSVKGNLALVQAYDGTHVFRRTNVGWTQVGKTQNVGAVNLVMGGAFAFGRDNGGVAIFRLDQRGILTRIQTFTANDVAPGASTLAASQNVLVVGAWGYNDAQGSVYIFSRRGQHWVKHQQLVASNGVPGDNFGISVAIAGKLIAIGAPEAQSLGPECNTSGVAYVFALHRRFWFEDQKVESPECGPPAYQFGSAVAISRGRLAVTIPAVFSLQSFGAFIYENDGGSFFPVAMTAFHDEESGEAMQMSGSTLVLGWPFQRCPLPQGCGHLGFAEIYELGHRFSANGTALPDDD